MIQVFVWKVSNRYQFSVINMFINKTIMTFTFWVHTKFWGNWKLLILICKGWYCYYFKSDSVSILLYLTSSDATGSLSSSPLIVSWDSFSLWTWARVQTARSTAYFNRCPNIFVIYYIYIYVCVPNFYYLSALVGCWSLVSIRRTIYKKIKCVSFWIHGCWG